MNRRVEQVVPLLPDHLIQSALRQTVETEPGCKPWGCSQAGSAMIHREEARLHVPAGWRFGQNGGRALVASAKPVFSAPFRGSPAVAQVVTDRQLVRVSHVLMPEIQRVHLTGEVPRRLSAPQRVRADYKFATKGPSQASAAVIEKLNPVIQGTAFYFTPRW